MGAFANLSPYKVTGLPQGQAPASSSPNPIPGISRSSGPSADNNTAPWHPDNALFWFGALAAVTLGLIAANASIRVGPFKASAGAGKS